jgi:hypothetical protein
MLIAGLVLLIVSTVVLWLCLPGADREVRRFLRSGLEVFAAIAIAIGYGTSVMFIAAGLMS